MTAVESNDQSELVASLENARDAALVESNQLRDQLQQARVTLDDKDGTIAELTGRTAALQRDLALAQEEAMQNDQSALIAKLETNLEIARRAQLSAVEQSEMVASLEQARDSAQTDALRLQSELATVRESLADARSEETRLRAELTEVRHAAQSNDQSDQPWNGNGMPPGPSPTA